MQLELMPGCNKMRTSWHSIVLSVLLVGGVEEGAVTYEYGQTHRLVEK